VGKLLILLGLWGFLAGERRGRGCRGLTLGSHNVDTLEGVHGWSVATAQPEAA
jgi:hypothetical protein